MKMLYRYYPKYITATTYKEGTITQGRAVIDKNGMDFAKIKAALLALKPYNHTGEPLDVLITKLNIEVAECTI